MKIQDVMWFTVQEKAFGIVYGEDEITKKRKAYISCVPGIDEERDIQCILENGTKFLPEQAKILHHYLNNQEGL